LIVLVLALYFVVTSAGFLKGVILPHASKALNASITVSDASISPFSRVVLKGLKVQTSGAEPLVECAEVRLRYSLTDILRGNLHVDEVALVSPKVVVVENPDGTSNLDPILKSQQPKPKEQKPARPTQPAKPLQIDLKELSITGAILRQVKLYPSGTRDVTECSNVNLTISGVKNGQTGKLALGADIHLQSNPAPGSNALLQARLDGDFTFALSPELSPSALKGASRIEVGRAEGGLAQLATVGCSLDCEVTPAEIKQVALVLRKGAESLGQLRVSGPFDMQKLEGRILVELAGVDQKLLNVAGGAAGLSFGTSTVSSTNVIQLAKGGALITAGGQFGLDRLQVTRDGQTTPTLDLHATYDVSLDRAASHAVVRDFTLVGTQQGKPLLRSELSAPMPVSWGDSANAVGDAALKLTLTGFNLADWRPFTGGLAPGGTLGAQATLLSQQAGKQLTFSLNSSLVDFTAALGSNSIPPLSITLQVEGKAAKLKQIDLSQCALKVLRENQSLVTLAASGTCDLATTNADFQLAVQAALGGLAQLRPQTNLSVSSGTFELKTRLSQTPQAQNVTGTFALADLSGKIGQSALGSLGAAGDYDLGMAARHLLIRRVAARLTEASKPGGNFEFAGTFNLDNQSAQLTAQLTDLNQNGVGPFLEAALADKKLVSVAINANATAQYDPEAESSFKADLSVTNLVVNDPSGKVPAKPLEAALQMDVGQRKQVVDLRKLQLSLTPTSRGTNQVQLTGQIEMTQANALQGGVPQTNTLFSGNLKLTADSLDFTTGYDLFTGQTKAAAAQPVAGGPKPGAAPSAPPTASTGPAEEPAPAVLPVLNFTVEANIGHLYLREIEVADWQVSAKLERTHLAVNPFKLKLNGAPVGSTVDLDLSVPGSKYAFACNAQAIPLAPLVNTFKPERKGILSGTLTAGARIDGIGSTGASLKKSLAGNFDIVSTNLNLSVDNIEGKTIGTRLLKTIIQSIAVIPDLAKNPAGTGRSLLQGLTGLGSAGTANPTGGLTADLKKSPINSIVVHGTAGSGSINLQQALVQSPAFEAVVTGAVHLDDVLTNSTLQLPVSVLLERSVAQRINLAGNTPTNAAYAQLPNFLTITGTLGKNAPTINYRALLPSAGSILQGMGGKAGQAGGLLQGLGGIIGGGNTNAPANANTPATNQNPVNNLLDDFFGPKKK